LERCCARLVRVERIHDGARVLYGDAIQGYLSWSLEVGKGKYADINTEGILDVAMLAQPFQGGGKFVFVPPQQGFFHEQFDYIFTIEFAANNSAPLTREFGFRVLEKNKYAVPDGDGGLTTKALPPVEFKAI